MKFSYLTGEVGNIGIVKIKKQAIGINWWLAGGIDPASVAAVWQPKGAASLAASYLRLAGDQGYTNIDPAIVGGVAPNWTSTTGWIGNGLSKYLISGVVPSDNTWSMIARISNGGAIAGDHCICGTSTNVTNLFELWDRSGSFAFYGNGVIAPTAIIPGGTLGFAGKSAYKNGAFDLTIGAGATNVVLPIVFLGGQRTASRYYTACNFMAIAIYKLTISAPQVAALHAAMMAL